jgi:hypothetical protein
MIEPAGSAIPARLAPFLAQWDYIQGVLFERLEGLSDEEYVWEPLPSMLSVRNVDGSPRPDQHGLEPTGEVARPRTIAWSVGHLGTGCWERWDYLAGDRRLQRGDLVWPMNAADGVSLLREGLGRWRSALESMTDEDLDTVGHSSFPWGLDPQLPLIEIVWWVNKELIYHAGEIWLMRDMYAVWRAEGGKAGFGQSR